MNAIQQQWNQLSDRMGVQPKQFACLLGVLAVAVVILGLRFAPRATVATARPSSPKSFVDAGSSPIQTNETHSTTVSYSGVETQAAQFVVEMPFDQKSDRDPFKSFGSPEAAPAPMASTTAVPSMKMPGLLPGLMLKAVIRGELAVFGDQTVRIGDAIALPDGTFASVRAIAERSVTVEHENRLIEVSFGKANPSKAVSSGSAK